MTSRKTNGSKSIVFVWLDPELLSPHSRTTTSLLLEEGLIRRTSLTQLNATTSLKMCGKKSRVQPWTRLLGSLDTWVFLIRSLITKSSSSEERVPLLNKSSMDASYSTSKKWRSLRKESSLILAHSWTPHWCSADTFMLLEMTSTFTNTASLSKSGVALQRRSPELPYED